MRRTYKEEMAQTNHDDLGPELADVGRLLRDERPLPDDDVLERTRLRVRAGARRRGQGPAWTRTRQGELMKSRAAVTAVLTLGILMMATSSGLALSGISGDGSAGTAQYRNLGDNAPNTGSGGVDEPADEADTLGERGSGGEGSPGAQGTRQVTLTTDSAEKLPFTGFAAIVLLVGGLATLAAGLALRRSTRSAAR